MAGLAGGTARIDRLPITARTEPGGITASRRTARANAPADPGGRTRTGSGATSERGSANPGAVFALGQPPEARPGSLATPPAAAPAGTAGTTTASPTATAAAAMTTRPRPPAFAARRRIAVRTPCPPIPALPSRRDRGRPSTARSGPPGPDPRQRGRRRASGKTLRFPPGESERAEPE